MSVAVQYPFSQNCKDVVKELRKPDSAYDKRTLEAAEYVIRCINKYPSF